jgi:hypothetical protein
MLKLTGEFPRILQRPTSPTPSWLGRSQLPFSHPSRLWSLYRHASEHGCFVSIIERHHRQVGASGERVVSPLPFRILPFLGQSTRTPTRLTPQLIAECSEPMSQHSDR